MVIGAGAAQAEPVPAPTWTSAALPVTDTNLVSAAQPDAQTTWAAGFHITQVGKAGVLTPVLLTRKAGDPQGWVSTPTAALPDGTSARFNAVTATPDGSGWVVGDDTAQTGGIVTERWDGASWTLVTAPEPDTTYLHSAGLLGVSGMASNDTWAVGWNEYMDSAGRDRLEGLAEHWDGHVWTIMQLPRVPQGFGLDAVTETSPGDVWAAGYTADDDQPLLMHFDGHHWTKLTTPKYEGLAGELYGLAANGPDDVWAVGRTVLTDDDQGHALLEHWDGNTWQQVSAPKGAGRLSAVTVSSQGVIAVGRTTTANYPGPGADGYAIRLTGGTWQPLPLPSGTLFDPQGVVASPQGDITAVGNISDPSQLEPQPMILTGGN
jgi:hypothetical protein